MTRTELVLTRMNFIKQFDTYLKEHIGDDELYYDMWCMYYPDDATAEDLKSIAENDDEWLDIVRIFAKCCRIGEGEDM